MSTALSGRTMRLGMLLAVLVTSFVVVLPRPAAGCSCLSGFENLMDQMPAAFVGNAIGARSLDDQPIKIIRFEVGQWIKGDLGRVIEVRAEDLRGGAQSSCGSMPSSGRVGLFLGVSEEGELWGHTCGLMDPDLMLALAAGPTLSSTGIPRVMLAGWGSPVLTVLDDKGHLVASLDPRTGSADPWQRFSHSVCPGAKLLAQTDGLTLTTWDLETFTIRSRKDLTGLGLWSHGQLSCRDEEAGSVLMAIGEPGEIDIIDITTGDHILTTEAYGVWMGGSHLITQNQSQTAVIRVDLDTGERHTLREGRQWSVSGAPNPVNGNTAVIARTSDVWGDPRGSTVFVHDEAGEIEFQFELPWTDLGVSWNDENTVVVVVPEGMFYVAYLIDTPTGLLSAVTNWPSPQATGTAYEIFGIALDGGIWQGDAKNGLYGQIASSPELDNRYVLLSFLDARPIPVDSDLGKARDVWSVPALFLDDLEEHQEEPVDTGPPPPVAEPVIPLPGSDHRPQSVARAVFIGVLMVAVVTVVVRMGWRKDNT